jgi:hypothetical protein
MSELRKELLLKKERRQRAIEHLVKESIVNVVAEQAVEQQPAPTPTAPAEQPAPPQPAPEQTATAQQSVPRQYTVDDMIQELNAIRSGRSFTDPEIYGRLQIFFKDINEEQKATLDEMLTKIAELVTSVEDSTVVRQQQANQTGQATQPPPAEAPQQSAPMPGAENLAPQG